MVKRGPKLSGRGLLSPDSGNARKETIFLVGGLPLSQKSTLSWSENWLYANSPGFTCFLSKDIFSFRCAFTFFVPDVPLPEEEKPQNILGAMLRYGSYMAHTPGMCIVQTLGIFPNCLREGVKNVHFTVSYLWFFHKLSCLGLFYNIKVSYYKIKKGQHSTFSQMLTVSLAVKCLFFTPSLIIPPLIREIRGMIISNIEFIRHYTKKTI